MSKLINYPDFPYPADQLIKFIATAETITLMLKDYEIIHYTPTDYDAFMQWLTDHAIENVRTEIKTELRAITS